REPPVRSMENDSLEITAMPMADREAVRQVLGSDLGGHYILVDVRIAPKDGQKIAIHLDDFLLRTDKDGERTTPFAPSQIAGKGAAGDFGRREFGRRQEGGPSWPDLGRRTVGRPAAQEFGRAGSRRVVGCLRRGLRESPERLEGKAESYAGRLEGENTAREGN